MAGQWRRYSKKSGSFLSPHIINSAQYLIFLQTELLTILLFSQQNCLMSKNQTLRSMYFYSSYLSVNLDYLRALIHILNEILTKYQLKLLQQNQSQIKFIMGNTNGNQNRLIKHSRLGDVETVTDNQNVYIRYEVIVLDEKIQHEWQQQLIKTYQSQQLEFMFRAYKFETEKVPCGAAKKLKILFPFYPFVLSSEVQNRIDLKQPFEQAELLYLTYVLLQVSQFFEKSNEKSGNIKPENILINQNGSINLITKLSYPNFAINYNAAFYERESSYLAPQEMVQLEAANSSPKYDRPKSQAFSIGVCLLYASMLEDITSIYDFKKFKFNQTQLTQYLSKFRQKTTYSQFFKDITQKLLKVDPKQRLSPAQLYAYISPHQNQITSLKQFEANTQSCENALELYRKVSAFAKKEQVVQKQKQINSNNKSVLRMLGPRQQKQKNNESAEKSQKTQISNITPQTFNIDKIPKPENNKSVQYKQPIILAKNKINKLNSK